MYMSHVMTNQGNASAQSDQDPCCSLSVSLLVIGLVIRMRGCAGWSGSMLVANPLCWFCRDAAHIETS
jgi:hypothetical protein